jgi:hypothetical protein
MLMFFKAKAIGSIQNARVQRVRVGTVYPARVRVDTVYLARVCVDTVYPARVCVDTVYPARVRLDTVYPARVSVDTVYPARVRVDTVYAARVCVDTVYPPRKTEGPHSCYRFSLLEWKSSNSVVMIKIYRWVVECLMCMLYVYIGDINNLLLPNIYFMYYQV